MYKYDLLIALRLSYEFTTILTFRIYFKYVAKELTLFQVLGPFETNISILDLVNISCDE